MSSPAFNEQVLRSMNNGGGFSYDQYGNPVANNTYVGASQPTQTYSASFKTFETFSVKGAMVKTSLLLAVVVVSAVASLLFVPYSGLMPLAIVNFVVGLGLAFYLSHNPKAAKFAGSIYAVVEGLFMGLVSRLFAAQYGFDIVLQALVGTLGVSVAMFTLYSFGIIKVTEKFRSIVIGATMGAAVMYAIVFGLSVFTGLPLEWFYGSGLISIGLSLFVIALAAFNLVIDFDMVEMMSRNKVEKVYEWYAAYALMVTLVWMYFEILRLLAKAQSRN